MRKLLLISLFFVLQSSAQTAQNIVPLNKGILDISVRKYGPYLGLQRGKYTMLELGGEMIWKEVRLRKPTAHAVNAGFNYNFKHNTMGFDAGYWIRPHRFGLTYGLALAHRTDFSHHQLGIAPIVGFKVWMAHLRVGYYLLPDPNRFETNTLFISLRMGIISDRDIDMDWNGFRSKKKK